MRILFSILFFSSILCSKAWAQPRSYPLSWENTAGPLMRTEALGTPYTTTLKLPYIYDFSSKYLQLKNITNGTTVIVTSMRPHGLLTNDAVEISGAIAPVLVAGKKYINRISDYQFQLFDSVTLTTAAATQNTSIITYLRINKIGAIETVRPDTLAFYDNNGGVTITGGSAKNQPSYWTARFDGLNAYGVPYSTSPYAKGPTDSLRSQPFDLSTYTANDSIMMSFQYQIGGFGEIPDPNGDHFSLEFLDNTLQWNLVNDITVTSQSADSFYTVMVNINDPKYFHNAFAYRFTSFGRQSGAYDVWNLDYIYINKKRKATDPLIKDLRSEMAIKLF
jgi:hypothetical protein